MLWHILGKEDHVLDFTLVAKCNSRGEVARMPRMDKMVALYVIKRN
jgi:hypothetical protein